MKKPMQIVCLVIVMMITPFVYAKDKSHDHSAHKKGNHVSGDAIHESMVDGNHFSYKLIDMRDKMKNMPEMKDTHHLMVYIKDHKGKTVEKSTLGYLVENPDGTNQKKMAMGMGGGFGADLNFNEKGKYTVKTKALVGEKVLMDSFEYEVK